MNGFVLAGGQSRRMGRDKALLDVSGRALVQIAVERLRGLGMEPRISGARSDLAAFAPLIADSCAGCGPLGGIEAGLAASDQELNLFVAVDAPLVPDKFLRWLVQRADMSRAVATIPLLGGRVEPLCAVYSRKLLPGLRQALETGVFKVIRAVETAAAELGEQVDAFAMESVRSALPAGIWPGEPPLRDWFRNLNTPAEYERLRTGRERATGAERHHPIS